MPTVHASEEAREIQRREEWELREYWSREKSLDRNFSATQRAARFEHRERLETIREKARTDIALHRANTELEVKLAQTTTSRKRAWSPAVALAVCGIVFLQLCGKQVPQVLEDFLRK